MDSPVSAHSLVTPSAIQLNSCYNMNKYDLYTFCNTKSKYNLLLTAVYSCYKVSDDKKKTGFLDVLQQ